MNILKQKRNLPQRQTNKNLIKNKQKNKTNDFIFKRYRYQENNILAHHEPNNEKINKNQYYNNNQDKQLEKYKQELQNQVNQFDIISVDQDQLENNYPQQNDNNFNSKNRNELRSQKKEEFQTSQLFSKHHSNKQVIFDNLDQNNQDFNQTNPMELIDFQTDQNSQVDNQSDNLSEQITQFQFSHSDKLQKNLNNKQNKNKHHYNVSQLSQGSNNIMSPNQTLDSVANLQESSYLFFKKGKQLVQSHNFKKPPIQENPLKQQEQMNFPQYQIKKLTQNDNPFKDAIQYSNQKQQLKGIKIHSVAFNSQMNIQIYDKELFLSSKIPPGIILKCKLKRSSGFFSIMSPQYDLYLQNGMKHMISAKKNSFRNRQLFYLSTQTNNFQSPIRTLMANVLHNVYWLVDKPKIIERKKISYLDLLIEYKKIDQKNKKQRQIVVLCPPNLQAYHIGLQYDIPSIDFQWFKQNISLQLHNKHKNYLPVTKNSQKNFALIDSDDENQDIIMQSNSRQTLSGSIVNQKNQNKKDECQKYYYLKMQKQSQNIFDIQIQHPLTPLQAMAIILTRFDAQLK